MTISCLLYSLSLGLHRLLQLKICFSFHTWLRGRAIEWKLINKNGASCIICPIRGGKGEGFFQCHGAKMLVPSTLCKRPQMVGLLCVTSTSFKLHRKDPIRPSSYTMVRLWDRSIDMGWNLQEVQLELVKTNYDDLGSGI